MCCCISTTVRQSPPAPNGAQNVLVCINPFSQWIKIGAMPSLDSYKTAQWFHDEIVCRYGPPLIVHSNKGSKYNGKFDTYLQANGMDHRFAPKVNSRSNGLVKHTNHIINSALWSFVGTCPHGHWWEVLGNIAWSFRVLPTRALGYAPYVLVFKDPPWSASINTWHQPRYSRGVLRVGGDMETQGP